MIQFYYTYVLYSEFDKKLYVGCTQNLQERFKAHSKGEVPATRNRRPLKLQYYEACHDLRDARHREQYLKTTHGRRFIRQRLKSYLTG
ncbi:MAG TPA: excinuclease ABC subunit C [Candidatus Taylorbacteria bacterium]|nr:MAG: hypothetical protein UY03_C0015G0010 [Parcubacteria group bacterium GW2011_GWA2_47_64]KKU97243.1 MAG: hypothetical protein UY29_C0001G0037 [Parcubacteria group bacterium GW2011_GWC2_48_17]HBV01747.1 excinuclease ABC subunit C [Candidatus Taylorbacteria bacterium]